MSRSRRVQAEVETVEAGDHHPDRLPEQREEAGAVDRLLEQREEAGDHHRRTVTQMPKGRKS